MKITIKDIKNLHYFFPRYTRYSYWIDHDYVEKNTKHTYYFEPFYKKRIDAYRYKNIISVPNCLDQFLKYKRLPTMKKAYMKSFYLPAVKKGWVKFNQALYDYLGEN